MAKKTRHCPHENRTKVFRRSRSSRLVCCEECYRQELRKDIVQSQGEERVQWLEFLRDLDMTGAFKKPPKNPVEVKEFNPMCLKFVRPVTPERQNGSGFKLYRVRSKGILTSYFMGQFVELGVPTIAQAISSKAFATSGETYKPQIHIYKQEPKAYDYIDGVLIQGTYQEATVEDDTVIVAQMFTPQYIIVPKLARFWPNVTTTALWFATLLTVESTLGLLIKSDVSSEDTRQLVEGFLPTREHYSRLHKALWEY